MSSSLGASQSAGRMLEFTVSASGALSHRNRQGSQPDHHTPEYLQQTLSLELGRQERHLAWRLEVAHAMGDMDQVEDDVNMGFLTRFINHQLMQPNVLQLVRATDILAGTSHKRS